MVCCMGVEIICGVSNTYKLADVRTDRRRRRVV